MPSSFSSFQRFMIAAGLSSVLVLSFFLASIYATHTPLQQMRGIQMGVAIAIPLICGVLAAIKDDQFLERLANVLNQTHL